MIQRTNTVRSIHLENEDYPPSFFEKSVRDNRHSSYRMLTVVKLHH